MTVCIKIRGNFYFLLNFYNDIYSYNMINSFFIKIKIILAI